MSNFNKIKEVAKKAMDNDVQMSKDYDDSPDSTITIKNWIKTVQRKIERISDVDVIQEGSESSANSLQTDENSLANKVKKNKKRSETTGASVKSKKINLLLLRINRNKIKV